MSTAAVEGARAFTLAKADRVKAVVQAVAQQAPRLEDVSDEGLQKLAQIVTAEDLRDEMKKRVHQERIDYQGERDKYIVQASRTGSLRTKDLYSKALSRMEAWCSTQGISPLELTPARADDWIEAEKAQGRAAATVRLDVSGASAFWTWLERRHNELRNPFRGTRARPAKKAARKLAVPSDLEIRELESSAAPWLRAAIVLMGQGGLRVGGLRGLSINDARWTTVTKGKEQSGAVSQEAREAITRAGLSLRSPFEGFTTARISKAFECLGTEACSRGQDPGAVLRPRLAACVRGPGVRVNAGHLRNGEGARARERGRNGDLSAEPGPGRNGGVRSTASPPRVRYRAATRVV